MLRDLDGPFAHPATVHMLAEQAPADKGVSTVRKLVSAPRCAALDGVRQGGSSVWPLLTAAGVGLRVEWSYDTTQQAGELSTLCGIERSEDGVLACHEITKRLIDSPPSRGGEMHADGPGVVRIGPPADEASLLEVVDAVGHGARRDQCLGDQLSR